MRNEFSGSQTWGCPAGGSGCTNAQVLRYYEIMDINKWVCLAILAGNAAVYRVLFFITLKLKERRSA